MRSGLNKKLMAGIPQLNSDMSVTVRAEDGSIVHTISPIALTRGGIGYLYERLVGLHYEKRGYIVEYRSRFGYADRGVDLVAKNEREYRFIQCKFRSASIGRAQIETLLYAASVFVRDNLSPLQNHFDLVVPSIAVAFPERYRQKKRC